MKSLQDSEHRTILVLQQAARDVDVKVWRNPYEILVERAMVQRAKAQAVTDDGRAGLVGITHDVGGVEQTYFAEPTDRAAILIRGQDRPAELCLMNPLLHRTHHVAPLDLV